MHPPKAGLLLWQTGVKYERPCSGLAPHMSSADLQALVGHVVWFIQKSILIYLSM